MSSGIRGKAGVRLRSTRATQGGPQRVGRQGNKPSTLAPPSADAPPVLRRFQGRFRWEYADLEPYKLAMANPGEFAGASRQVLIGKRGERVAFHVRYFELEAGGYTSLERHRHSHVVIAVRGRGVAQVGDAEFVLKPLDTIYIGPGQTHQLRTRGRSRFGFFCIVDADRDKPRPVKSR